jgi:hypothetical protein
MITDASKQALTRFRIRDTEVVVLRSISSFSSYWTYHDATAYTRILFLIHRLTTVRRMLGKSNARDRRSPDAVKPMRRPLNKYPFATAVLWSATPLFLGYGEYVSSTHTGL